MHEAILYDKFDNNAVKCNLCAHLCKIEDGKRGICLVRKDIDGKLYTLTWGASSGFAIDPIEKKPFYHFKPGTRVLSFGTPCCNFHCLNCQNWQLSQIKKSIADNLKSEYTPELVADMAIKHNVDGIAYTYSEPTIFFEYARDIILNLRQNFPKIDIYHVFVSNGFFSKELLDLIISEKLLSAINIDLKFMNETKYKKITGGNLLPVLNNLEKLASLNNLIHIEVINLVIPNENDSDGDFKTISKFIASVSKEIPLHFSRFYPTNKMTDRASTDLERLLRAKEIAMAEGMKYVYLGNTNLKNVENTYCPKCNKLLIKRDGYSIKNNLIKNSTKCPICESNINIVL